MEGFFDARRGWICAFFAKPAAVAGNWCVFLLGIQYVLPLSLDMGFVAIAEPGGSDFQVRLLPIKKPGVGQCAGRFMMDGEAPWVNRVLPYFYPGFSLVRDGYTEVAEGRSEPVTICFVS